MDWFQKIALIIVIITAAKAVIGFRFPWEKCSCCGKKIREHKGFRESYCKKN